VKDFGEMPLNLEIEIISSHGMNNYDELGMISGRNNLVWTFHFVYLVLDKKVRRKGNKT